jgi:dethiobiotin synthetase
LSTPFGDFFQNKSQVLRPGLFIVGTDTSVGKTAATCSIAMALRRQRAGMKVGPLKPFATGCRLDREGMVSEDGEALAHFSDCRQPLDVITPSRYRPPLAPAAAAELTGQPIDWQAIAASYRRLSEASDVLLVEGVGGLLVPLDPDRPGLTCRELAVVLGYPVVVVCRSVLGTLNHSAMTVELLRTAGVEIAGLVMNGFDAEPTAQAEDPSIALNQRWLERMTGLDVLAILPRSDAVDPPRGQLDETLIQAASQVDWLRLMKPPRQLPIP